MGTARFPDFITLKSPVHEMMPRFCYPPHPGGFVPGEGPQGCVEGNDPVPGQPLMQELVDALTKPLTKEEKNPIIVKKPRHARLLPADTDENLNRLFLENAGT